MRQQLPVSEILAYCKKCADVQKNRYDSLLEGSTKEAADPSTVTAMAMYKHEETKFRYDIPAVITALAASDEVLIPEICNRGSKLKALRIEKGLSQAELANKAQIGLRAISNYENVPESINKAQGISLYRLAQVLGCSMEDLLDFRN